MSKSKTRAAKSSCAAIVACFAGALVLVLYPSTGQAEGRVVDEKSQPFVVTFENGLKEKYLVSYSTMLNEIRQTSGRASGFTHPRDDRICQWQSSALVRRDVYKVTEEGVRLPLESLSEVFSDDGGKQWKLNGRERGPCGAVAHTIEPRVKVILSAAKIEMASVAVADAKKIQAALLEQLKAVAVRTEENETVAVQKAVDAYIDTLRKAALAYGTPKQVQRGDNFRVRAIISFGSTPEELRKGLGDFGTTVADMIKAGPIMEATLVGSHGLSVSSVGSPTRAIPSKGDVAWEWSIDATETGRQTLTLEFTTIVQAAGSARYPLRTDRRDIVVSVTAMNSVKDFVSNNWQWLWAVVLVPIGTLIWRKWTKSVPAEPRPRWRDRFKRRP